MDSKNIMNDKIPSVINHETQREIFCRLANSRVGKVVYALDILSKLSSRRSDYTEEDDLDREGRRLSSGTFALQAHDPGSKVLYKNVRVKVLPWLQKS